MDGRALRRPDDHRPIQCLLFWRCRRRARRLRRALGRLCRARRRARLWRAARRLGSAVRSFVPVGFALAPRGNEAGEERPDVCALGPHADVGDHVRADACSVEHRFCGSEPDGGRRGGVSYQLPEELERVFCELRELESGSALTAGCHISEAGRGCWLCQGSPYRDAVNAELRGDLSDAESLECEFDGLRSSRARAVARAVARCHLPRGSPKTRRIARSAAGCHADGRPVDRTNVLIALGGVEDVLGVDGVEDVLGVGGVLLFT